MGMIYLKNIKVYAYHGCLAEGTLIGSDYLVQLKVWADLKKSTTSDQLEDTVDYVLLNAIVKKEMASPSKLLEHVAQRIINSIFKQANLVDEVELSVAKINPPIGGDVAAVSVILREKRV